ncbi:MAG TPA: hypothetical protein VFR32_01095 [Gaiellaceae bacterium]|nr:hypothetical protein [Gaiellaceae bacterium]
MGALAVGTRAGGDPEPAQAQAGPEYALLLSYMSTGLKSRLKVYTCASDIAAKTALKILLAGVPDNERAKVIRDFGNRIISVWLGSPDDPLPQNTQRHTYRGATVLFDFIKRSKGRPTLYVKIRNVERLARGILPQLEAENGVAMQSKGRYVLITRRDTAMPVGLLKSFKGLPGGRIKLLRCLESVD